jgi:hypothetical protein
MQVGEDEEGMPGLDSMVLESETPSAIVRGQELSDRARALLGDILRDWVEETWSTGEFTRLSVIESLFSGSWRNRDAWKFFGLRDETAVAGIKFRALKRLRQLAAVRESGSDLLPLLSAAEEGHRLLDMDVQEIWHERRVSCPARHWIARFVAANLEEGPTTFMRFHLDEMKCPWCQANRDDLAVPGREAELEPLLGKLEKSTLQYLHSRKLGQDD